MATTRTFEENCATATAQLRRFADAPLLHLIGGEPTPSVSGATFDNHSPIDGALLGAVASGDSADIDAAARAAADAFGDWSRRTGQERKRILHDVADLIVERADEIAVVEMRRHRSADALHERRGDARRGELPLLRRPRARRRPTGCALPDRAPSELHQPRQPIGPVGVITPWNTPFMLSTWKIAPALAAGCTVVHKPAEWSPLHGRPAGGDRARGGAAGRRGEHRARHRRDGRPGADRASGHQARSAFIGESRTGSAHPGARRRRPSSACTSSSAARTR